MGCSVILYPMPTFSSKHVNTIYMDFLPRQCSFGSTTNRKTKNLSNLYEMLCDCIPNAHPFFKTRGHHLHGISSVWFPDMQPWRDGKEKRKTSPIEMGCYVFLCPLYVHSFFKTLRHHIHGFPSMTKFLQLCSKPEN